MEHTKTGEQLHQLALQTMGRDWKSGQLDLGRLTDYG